MDLGTAVRDVLLNDGSVYAVASTRIMPGLLESADQFPCITFRIVSAVDLNTLLGPSGAKQARVQVDSWSRDYQEAWSLALKVKTALVGLTGEIGGDGSSVQGVTVHHSSPLADRELWDEDLQAWHIATDIMFLYEGDS